MAPDPSLHAGWISGFCNVGAHEGKIKHSPSGKEIKSCIAVDLCKCTCHKIFNEMREFIAKNRDGSPEYMPPRTIPVSSPVQPTVLPKGTVTVLRSPGVVPPTGSIPETRRLDSGRRARGSLDGEVLRVCSEWVEGLIQGDEDGNLTPKFVGAKINASSGAVSACWARWVKAGKCELGVKPARFLRFKD